MTNTSRIRERGFTLVELLVVVSIIALLIAILLPSLKKARVQAKNVKCGSQLHDIGVGFGAYAVEFNRFPHQNSFGGNAFNNDRGSRNAIGILTYAVHKEIARHMGGLQANKAGAVDANGKLLLTRQHEVFYCPFVNLKDIEFADELHGDYPDGTSTGRGSHVSEDVYLQIPYAYAGGLNEVANDPKKTTSYAFNATDEMKAHIEAKRKGYAKKEPDSTKVLFADMVMMWNGGNVWRINHGQGWGTKIPAASNFLAPRVDGGNVMYGDAHVEWKGPKHYRELNELPPGAQSKLGASRNGSLVMGSDAVWW